MTQWKPPYTAPPNAAFMNGRKTVNGGADSVSMMGRTQKVEIWPYFC